MVKIRLTRLGAKKVPFYRIIVTDSKSPRDGKYIAEIGTYEPLKNPAAYTLDEEAAKKWIANGAIPTEKVNAILKKAGIVK
jgi:small subunit ribosomal protein S16